MHFLRLVAFARQEGVTGVATFLSVLTAGAAGAQESICSEPGRERRENVLSPRRTVGIGGCFLGKAWEHFPLPVASPGLLLTRIAQQPECSCPGFLQNPPVAPSTKGASQEAPWKKGCVQRTLGSAAVTSSLFFTEF